ncbi:MAG TPA: type II toxin-antitoxin system HicB family antitoxin [Acetobacteraceae bacterium]
MATRFYPAVIEGSDRNGYDVVFPDFPGCVSTGDTIQEAATGAVEALSLHVEGIVAEGLALPAPSAPDAALPDWLPEDGIRVLVPAEIPGRAVRANITLDEALLARLDAAAAAQGTSRSGFIAQAVREHLRP